MHFPSSTRASSYNVTVLVYIIILRNIVWSANLVGCHMDQVVRAATEPGFLLPVFDQELVALNAFTFTIYMEGGVPLKTHLHTNDVCTLQLC